MEEVRKSIKRGCNQMSAEEPAEDGEETRPQQIPRWMREETETTQSPDNANANMAPSDASQGHRGIKRIREELSEPMIQRTAVKTPKIEVMENPRKRKLNSLSKEGSDEEGHTKAKDPDAQPRKPKKVLRQMREGHTTITSSLLESFFGHPRPPE